LQTATGRIILKSLGGKKKEKRSVRTPRKNTGGVYQVQKRESQTPRRVKDGRKNHCPDLGRGTTRNTTIGTLKGGTNGFHRSEGPLRAIDIIGEVEQGKRSEVQSDVGEKVQQFSMVNTL